MTNEPKTRTEAELHTALADEAAKIIAETPRRRRGRPRKRAHAAQAVDLSQAPPARHAPDLRVSERQAEPQEALYDADLDTAQRLIDRRLERGVFDYSSGAIRFTDPRFVGRWFNEGVNGQQIYRARQRGWLLATPAMIADLDQLGLYTLDRNGAVVRGQRGEEHLMFMTRENYTRIMARKTQENRQRMGSTRRVKADLAQSVGQQLGSEAGDWIDRHVIGDVTDHVERVERYEDEDTSKP